MLTARGPQHVLITTSTFPLDADDRVSARFVLDLAQHLTAHCRVTVLAPAGPRSGAREQWGDVTVRRFQYFVPARWQSLATGEGMVARMRASKLALLQAPGFVAAQWAMLPRVLREERVDFLNPHWIVPQGIVAAAWKRRLQLPMVLTAHGADVAWLSRSPVGKRVARYVLSRSDGLIAASTALAKRAESIAGMTISHAAIPMGVETSRFTPRGDAGAARSASAAPRILFVGKFVPKKGISVLVNAFAQLRRAGSQATLLLIGGGPLEAAIRTQVAQLGLADAVQFLGWMRNDELPAQYQRADVVCIPSVEDAFGETEGTPVVLQESLASAAIVVGSTSSGLGDVIRNGENGWSVPPGDADALATTLKTALDASPADREAMRRAARATAEEFEWSRVATRFYERFAMAMSAASQSGATRAKAQPR